MSVNRSSSPFPDRVREAIRVRHYSVRTEQAYVAWVHRFILFHGKRHPTAMGARKAGAFLSRLAVDCRVVPNTRNQTLNASVFLYANVLRQPLGELPEVLGAVRSPLGAVVNSGAGEGSAR
jgi:hypothetical protein